MKNLIFIALPLCFFAPVAHAQLQCSEILSFKNRFEDPVLKEIFGQLGFTRDAIRNKKHDEAIARAKEVLRMDVRNPEAHGLLGIALEATGKINEAMTSYRQAFNLMDGHSKLFLKLNKHYQESGQLQKQLEVIDIMIAKDPGKVDYVLRKVEWLLKDSDPESAREVLSKTLQEYPNHIRVLEAHFKILKAEGKLEKALSVLNTVLSRRASFDKTLEIERIELLGKLEKFERQLQAIEQLAKKDSNIQGLQRKKVATLIELEKYEQALEALQGVQSNKAARKLEAQINYHLGRMDKAYDILKALARDLTEVDTFVIAALVKIEKGEIPLKKFQPSPFLEAIVKSLNPQEVIELASIRDAVFWSFKPQDVGETKALITNSFWENTAYFRSPIDGNATGELVGQSGR